MEQYDVIVCGGGPAGLGAAAAAAMCGAKTLLLEARSFFGGIAGTSLFMPMNRMKLNGGPRGFVHDALIKEIEKFGELSSLPGKVTWTDGDGLHIHPDYLKKAVFDLLDGCGCEYLLYSPAVGAEVLDGRVTAVKIQTKQGIRRYEAKVFIDCTGDGDLSFYAGAEYAIGRETDGALMPVTLGFSLANVDTERLFGWYNSEQSGPDMRRITAAAEAEGYAVSPWYSFDRTTIPQVASVNNGGLKGIGRLDMTDPADATRAEHENIRVALDFIEIAHKYRIPGLEDCRLDRTGAAVGARETRRILCDYVLTEEDAYSGADFPDVIARRYGAVDQAGLTDQMGHSKMQSGYAFPYRALLVRNFENLMAAGKCGSYTHLGLASGKSMGNMMAIGQAAGTAAALSVKERCTLRALPYQKVQQVLRARGVLL